MKGDRVETVVDAGNTTRTYEVVASRAGRRVATAVRLGVVEVSEVTRWGPMPFRGPFTMSVRSGRVVWCRASQGAGKPS
ncbi:hypothetical protein [Streptomyces sp. AK010]|uniref:hypothetical protein n=1 Tax=Streptomyces sp. AK010 TaxID=2723074 RepID=UPI0037D9999F